MDVAIDLLTEPDVITAKVLNEKKETIYEYV